MLRRFIIYLTALMALITVFNGWPPPPPVGASGAEWQQHLGTLLFFGVAALVWAVVAEGIFRAARWIGKKKPGD